METEKKIEIEGVRSLIFRDREKKRKRERRESEGGRKI